MSGILTDDHLESLQCTICHKYLPVFPIKIHLNREVTCGRCSFEDGGGAWLVLYQLLAEKYLFGCMNRYKGCRKLLRADEMAAHEKVCLGKHYHCWKCSDRTDRSMLELIWHYKLGRPSSRNDWPPPRDDAMLFVRYDIVFFVLFRFEPSPDDMRMCAVTLTADDVTQIIVAAREDKVLNRVEEKHCKSMSTFDGDYFSVRLESGGPIEMMFNLEVSRPNEPYSISNNVNPSGDGKAGQIFVTETVVSESRDEPPETIEESSGTPNGEQFMRPLLIEPFRSSSGYRLNDSGTALVNANGFEVDLTCSNCKQLIGLPIYQCKCLFVKHNICNSCRFWCGLCNCTIMSTEQKGTLLFELSSHLQFPCKWKCGGYCTTYIHIHERVCKRRIKECPECALKIHLDFMKDHLQDVHKVFFSEVFYTSTIEWCIKDSGRGGTVYFLLNDKWCYLKCIRDDSNLNDGRHSTNNITPYYLDFFTQDEKLNTKLKIIKNSSVVVSPTKIRWCKEDLDKYIYTPYLDFNAT